MASRREEYFKNYQLEQVPDHSKKGYKNVYKYIGDYYSWNVSADCLKKQKLLFGACEFLTVITFLWASARPVILNQNIFIILPAMLALICWLFEIIVMATFCFVKQPMRQDDYQKIKHTLPIVLLLRSFCLLAVTIACILLSIIKSPDITGIAAIFCYAADCILSIIMRQSFLKFSQNSSIICRE